MAQKGRTNEREGEAGVKKLIIALVVVSLLAIGAGVLAFFQWKTAGELAEQVQALTDVSGQLEQVTQASEQQKVSMAGLLEKERQFDAVKEALSSGVLLQDLEAILKSPQAQTPERILAQGAVRLLVLGKDDPSVTESFDRALKMMDIQNRMSAICAAQAGMVAAGREVDMLSECQKRLAPPPEPPPAPAPPANTKSGPAPASNTKAAPAAAPRAPAPAPTTGAK
ncbi:MAG: Carbonic anhydrase precursor [Pseudomonadota bacterium]|jgi:hypothetical protein